MTEHPTADLAAFVAALRYDDIPVSVIDHAKLCLLDTLACGLYGSTLPWTRILTNTSLAWGAGGAGGSTLWGTRERLSAPDAALVNGSAVHAFELDDLHRQSIVHPGSVVVSAVLAVAETHPAITGRQALAAIVAGYEAASRVGMSLGAAHLNQGWHPTGTHGAIGAAAGVGNLLGLSAEQVHDALGIAATQSAGLMAAQYGAMVKRFHAGRAAQSGVYAGLLAGNGYTGIRDVFETEYGGYCTTFSPARDLSYLTRGLGTVWETALVVFKKYSTNGSCHPAIEGLLDLRRDHGVRAEDVSRVDIYSSTATYKHVGWPYQPDSVMTAQMNLPYITAVVLTDGAASVDQFSEERIHDPELVKLSGRVKVHADPAVDARGDAFRHSTRLEVRLYDGTILYAAKDRATSSTGVALRREVEAKYAHLAGKALPDDQAATIADLVANLEHVRSASDLARSMQMHTGFD